MNFVYEIHLELYDKYWEGMPEGIELDEPPWARFDEVIWSDGQFEYFTDYWRKHKDNITHSQDKWDNYIFPEGAFGGHYPYLEASPLPGIGPESEKEMKPYIASEVLSLSVLFPLY